MTFKRGEEPYDKLGVGVELTPEERELICDEYNGFVHIDLHSNIVGTEFPKGTKYSPVNNLADAIRIAKRYKLRLDIKDEDKDNI